MSKLINIKGNIYQFQHTAFLPYLLVNKYLLHISQDVARGAFNPSEFSWGHYNNTGSVTNAKTNKSTELAEIIGMGSDSCVYGCKFLEIHRKFVEKY